MAYKCAKIMYVGTENDSNPRYIVDCYYVFMFKFLLLPFTICVSSQINL